MCITDDNNKHIIEDLNISQEDKICFLLFPGVFSAIYQLRVKS